MTAHPRSTSTAPPAWIAVPAAIALAVAVIPVVALAISAFVENYRATPAALVGLAAILAGNVLVLLDRKQASRI